MDEILDFLDVQSKRKQITHSLTNKEFKNPTISLRRRFILLLSEFPVTTPNPRHFIHYPDNDRRYLNVIHFVSTSMNYHEGSTMTYNLCLSCQGHSMAVIGNNP